MKRYIVAMSFPRKKCLARLNSMSETFNRHVMECIIYKESRIDTLDHWCDEIGAWLNDANDLKCDSKLKEADYLSTIFGDFGNEDSDARINLRIYQDNNRKLLRKHSDDAYPDFEITPELINELSDFYSDIVDMAIPILMSGQVLSASEWSAKIRSLLH